MTTTTTSALVTTALEQQLAPDRHPGDTHSVVVDKVLDDDTVRATLYAETDDGPVEVATVTLAVTPTP